MNGASVYSNDILTCQAGIRDSVHIGFNDQSAGKVFRSKPQSRDFGRRIHLVRVGAAFCPPHRKRRIVTARQVAVEDADITAVI